MKKITDKNIIRANQRKRRPFEVDENSWLYVDEREFALLGPNRSPGLSNTAQIVIPTNRLIKALLERGLVPAVRSQKKGKGK